MKNNEEKNKINRISRKINIRERIGIENVRNFLLAHKVVERRFTC